MLSTTGTSTASTFKLSAEAERLVISTPCPFALSVHAAPHVLRSMVGVARGQTQRFKGGAYLRHRLVLATLASRAVRFDDVRADDSEAPGLSPAEVSFVRLLDKLTNGSVIEINETGTTLLYRPGFLVGPAGSSRLAHECHPSRPVSYYLEPLLMLAPFSKRPLNITLRGPTHGTSDVCADSVAGVTVPLLRRLALGTPLAPVVNVRKRGVASGKGSNGGGRAGMVEFQCGLLSNKLPAIELVESGVVKRIRGVAFANRVSPVYITRMVDAAREVLNRFSPDVYIHTDHNNHIDCGIGFGLHLIAETTDGCLIGADWSGMDKDTTPESVARAAVGMLLEEVEHGGCVDSNSTCLALLYCALADSDVSRVRVGRLSDASIAFLRDLQLFFGVTFKIKVEDQIDDDGDESDDGDADAVPAPRGIVMSCIGIGHTNVARQRF